EQGFVNDTSKLRIVVQLERWYLDENGEEQKIDDLFEPITLYGDQTTYKGKGYPDSYEETSDPAHGDKWSAKFSELPKKGQVNGKTVVYIYKIAETRAYLTDTIDSNQNDLIKLGIINSSAEDGENSSTITNTFPKTSLDVEKKWMDKDGNLITPPVGITVTIQLQRRQRDLSGNYDYSGDIHPGEWSDYEDVAGKTLTLQGNEWTGSFSDLPVNGWHQDETTENKFSFLEYEYRVVESSVTINNEPVDKHYTTAVEMQDIGQTDKKAVITNTEVETESYEVTKIWKDTEDKNVSWVKDITIILHKKSDTETTYTYTVSEVTGDDGVKSYKATSSQEGAPIAVVSGNATEGYKIKWDKLDIGFEYWTTEEKVEGYKDPIYATEVSDNRYKDTDNAGNKLTKAENKGYIINRPEDAVSLPESGGFGTTSFYTIGLLLIAFAAGLYTYFNKKKLIAIRSDRRNSGTGRGKSRRRGGDGL
ncbi:LPXTG cell wall anchor domain-containing protein, partial [Butyrivibrio sp.]|uniref:LPXTG cell wall anchor domain-containing protein n=1 Tax=Butyrivibrio sp. TaxID=28121 RepID=UPI0025C18449